MAEGEGSSRVPVRVRQIDQKTLAKMNSNIEAATKTKG